MRVNYETDESGRLQSVTIYPLDTAKPTLELPDEFDLKRIRDYVLKNGALIRDPCEPAPSAAERIAALKRKLSETDYAIIKIAEGAATTADYADLIAQRQTWRTEINDLEGQIDD